MQSIKQKRTKRKTTTLHPYNNLNPQIPIPTINIPPTTIPTVVFFQFPYFNCCFVNFPFSK
eukprot:UN03652